jgi:hypothetical protein
MVQRPVRKAAKRANIFIQQQQSSTPYMTQRPLTTQYSSDSHNGTPNLHHPHSIPIQHHRIIVADDEMVVVEKRNGEVGMLKANGPLESMHYCPTSSTIDSSYPTVVVAAENPYHIITDEHYRGANYIYETTYSASPYYSVSFKV